MSKKINLEEFWNKRYPHGKLPKYAKDIIIEYSKELLKLAAENATTEDVGTITDDGWAPYDIVNEQSILDTINQIE